MVLSVTLKKRVKGFELDVAWSMANELTVLFGYSGAGKSMTLQMIAGLMRPDEGTVRCDDEVYFDNAGKIMVPPRKRPFGYVFQDLALFPHMTVRKNIIYGIKGMKRNERRLLTDKIVERFHLKGLAHKLPSEISGGQKQRVALARALARRPKLLLLDEPFSALDNTVRIEMRSLLKEIRHEFNIPVILVTHDLVEAYTLADRMIVYYGGRVAQSGSRIEVFHDPCSEEVARLVDMRNHFGGLDIIHRQFTKAVPSFSGNVM